MFSKKKKGHKINSVNSVAHVSAVVKRNRFRVRESSEVHLSSLLELTALSEEG